jgi:hypothetical protein
MVGVAYGVRLEGDFPFNDLPLATPTGPWIKLEMQRPLVIPSHSGILLASHQTAGRTLNWITHSEDCLVVRFDDSFCFELWFSSNRICCYAVAEVPYLLLRYWILQQILPIFLILSGSFEFLHGTAVSTLTLKEGEVPAGSSCIGFHGPSHAGKSTILSYFLSKGHMLVTDDHLALSSTSVTEVVPSTPFYRPYRAVEDLGIVAENYSPTPRPLKRIYLLQPAAADAKVSLEELSESEAVWTFLKDTQYVWMDESIPGSLSLAARRFRNLSHLTRQVPVLRLHVPRSMERLEEVYDFVRKDLEA